MKNIFHPLSFSFSSTNLVFKAESSSREVFTISRAQEIASDKADKGRLQRFQEFFAKNDVFKKAQEALSDKGSAFRTLLEKRGDFNKSLQKFDKNPILNTDADGFYGSSTRLAVAYFQFLQFGENINEVDGALGPKTISKIEQGELVEEVESPEEPKNIQEFKEILQGMKEAERLLMVQVQDLTQRVATLTEENEELSGALQLAEQALERATGVIREYEEAEKKPKTEINRESFREELKELQQDLEKISESLEESEAKRNELEEREINLTQERDNLKKKFEETQATFEEYKRLIEEGDEVDPAMLIGLQEQIEAAQAEIAQLKKQQEGMRPFAEFNRLEIQLSELGNNLVRAEKAKTEVERIAQLRLESMEEAAKVISEFLNTHAQEGQEKIVVGSIPLSQVIAILEKRAESFEVSGDE